MNKLRMGLVALIGLGLNGCRSNGNQELVERELRMQEDQLYALQDALTCAQAMLDSTQRENESLKREIAGDKSPADTAPTPIIDLPSKPARPRRKPSSREEMPEAPMVEPGIPVMPGEEGGDAAPFGTPAEGASFSQPTDRQIVRLALNKQLTGGLNHDGRGGDEGLSVVFETRNAEGQLVKSAGDVSIAVIDPNRSGAEARIARWDFKAEEALMNFKKTALGRGYHFELPWPSQPPLGRKLDLFVRYTTADGKKLIAKSPIDVAPPAAHFPPTDRETRRWRSVPATQRRGAPLLGRRNTHPRLRPLSRSADGGEAPRAGDASSAQPPTVELGEPGALDTSTEKLPPESSPQSNSGDDRPADSTTDDKSQRPRWKPFR